MGWFDTYAPPPPPPSADAVDGSVAIAIACTVGVLAALVVWTYTTSAIQFALKWLGMYGVVRAAEWYLDEQMGAYWAATHLVTRAWNATFPG
jgi:hypothetical protein